jgi:hypothetical protein
VADNTTINAGSGGDTIATDDISGVKYPRGKVGFGVDGSYVDVSASNPLPATLATLPALAAGSATIGAVNFAQQLDAVNDAVRARIISGVLDDGAGVSLTIKSAAGTASSSGVNAAVAAVTSKKIRVLSYSLQAANANGSSVAANWQDDAGTPVVLSQTWDLAAREGVSKPLSNGPGFYFQTTAGQALKLNLGSALSVRWEVVYVEA